MVYEIHAKIGKIIDVALISDANCCIIKGNWLLDRPTGWRSNNAIAAFLIESGGAIIENLPILFAVGIAIGMSQERELTVTLSAVGSYMIVFRPLSPPAVALIKGIPEAEVCALLKILQMHLLE
ncbi:MAG: hypothetical protein V8R63_08280 [Thomasclavelia ramosa]